MLNFGKFIYRVFDGRGHLSQANKSEKRINIIKNLILKLNFKYYFK